LVATPSSTPPTTTTTHIRGTQLTVRVYVRDCIALAMMPRTCTEKATCSTDGSGNIRAVTAEQSATPCQRQQEGTVSYSTGKGLCCHYSRFAKQCTHIVNMYARTWASTTYVRARRRRNILHPRNRVSIGTPGPASGAVQGEPSAAPLVHITGQCMFVETATHNMPRVVHYE
jgi:hypothetical protein